MRGEEKVGREKIEGDFVAIRSFHTHQAATSTPAFIGKKMALFIGNYDGKKKKKSQRKRAVRDPKQRRTKELTIEAILSLSVFSGNI